MHVCMVCVCVTNKPVSQQSITAKSSACSTCHDVLRPFSISCNSDYSNLYTCNLNNTAASAAATGTHCSAALGTGCQKTAKSVATHSITKSINTGSMSRKELAIIRRPAAQLRGGTPAGNHQAGTRPSLALYVAADAVRAEPRWRGWDGMDCS